LKTPAKARSSPIRNPFLAEIQRQNYEFELGNAVDCSRGIADNSSKSVDIGVAEIRYWASAVDIGIAIGISISLGEAEYRSSNTTGNCFVVTEMKIISDL
jgi:hypothetical protein